jgi:hypothetical protein
MLDRKQPPNPLPKPAVKHNKLATLQDDPHTFFRFCNLHTPHRPKISITPVGQQAETKLLFLLKATKSNHLDPSYWACFFTILDGEFSDWGYVALGTREVRALGVET